MANYNTRLDLARQSRINLNETANLEGSMAIGQNFFISSVKIDVNNSQPDYVLTYDPLSNAYIPSPSSNTLLPNDRIIYGMQLSGNTNNALNFQVTSGLYTINNTYYPFSGYNFTINSGDTLYDRYDLVYVSGGTGSNVTYVLQGTPSASPVIPIQPMSAITLGIIVVPVGLTITGSSSTINPTYINASNVTYNRGIYTNIQSYLDGNYIFPVINDFTNDVKPIQYNDVVTGITFTWSSNKTGHEFDLDLLVTGVTFNNTTYSYTYINGFSGNLSNSAATFTLTFDDGITTTSKTTSIYFYNKRYFGTHSSSTLTSSQIINLEFNEFDYNNKQFSLKTLSGGSKYIYFCYPRRLGLPNMFVNGMYSNDFDITIKNVTNPFFFTEQYYVIRTTNIIHTDNMYFESR